jgi:ornithine carbamoyltransferase
LDLKGRHLIGLEDYRREEVDHLLTHCVVLRKEWREGRGRRSLAGRSVALIFEKPSTRTRVSFEVGVAQLGGHPVVLSSEQMQLRRGEPLKDTARVLSRYVDAVVIRANHHEDVVELARWSQVPIINGLTDLLHPCQILADLFTLRQHGLDLDAIRIAFIGDGNNVANSWIDAAALYRFELAIACPAEYDPDSRLLAAARARGARVEIVRDPAEAARGADLLYTDVWVSMGQDGEADQRLEVFAGYQINERLIGLAAAGCKVMHCLPAHRGQEITDEAMEGPRSIVFEQAENRLHIQKAILDLLAGKEAP